MLQGTICLVPTEWERRQRLELSQGEWAHHGAHGGHGWFTRKAGYDGWVGIQKAVKRDGHWDWGEKRWVYFLPWTQESQYSEYQLLFIPIREHPGRLCIREADHHNEWAGPGDFYLEIARGFKMPQNNNDKEGEGAKSWKPHSLSLDSACPELTWLTHVPWPRYSAQRGLINHETCPIYWDAGDQGAARMRSGSSLDRLSLSCLLDNQMEMDGFGQTIWEFRNNIWAGAGIMWMSLTYGWYKIVSLEETHLEGGREGERETETERDRGGGQRVVRELEYCRDTKENEDW